MSASTARLAGAVMTRAIVAATIFLGCLFSFTGCDILDDQCLRRPESAECN